MKSVKVIVMLLWALGLAAACTNQAGPITVIETVIVEKEVVVVETVEVEKHPIAPATPETNDNQIVYAIYRDPEILNPYLFTRMAAGEAYRPIGEGLIGVGPEGRYFPVLAKEVPTVQNGWVTADGLTVTYPLQDGVLWSDGVPFTCDDVLFTWQAVTHPESGAVSREGYDQVENIECPDAQTVVIRFKQFYAPYLTLFSGFGNHGILPRHAAGNPADMQQWSYNWFPIGTGPFKLQEWSPGDHLTYVPNQTYRHYPAKPAIDKLIIRIVADREAGKKLLQAGEVDVLGDATEADVMEFAGDSDIVLHIKSGPGTERLILNLADPNLDATGDPINNPHWALADVRVRQAIQFAIDKDFINQTALFGLAQVGTGELNSGWAQADIPTGEYNPHKAIVLLEEAGWIDGNGDGLRECRGCLYAEPGHPLRLILHTTLGDTLRRDTARHLQKMLQEVGIELAVEFVPPAVLFGPWESGALRKHGNFDILMYTAGGNVDPQLQLEQYFHKQNIPTAANGGSGANYSRWMNDEFSNLLDQAGAEPNIEKRKTLYRRALKILSEELPHIYLYNRNSIHLTGGRVQGFEVNFWTNQTWNVADWTIK